MDSETSDRGTDRRNTILFIRSSAPSHCLSLLNFLRESDHPDASTRWILILQPAVEKQFTEAMRNAQIEVMKYDHGPFTYRDLARTFSTRLRNLHIDAAYVPFNTADGRGYLQIVRFLSSAGIPKIIAYPPNGDLKEITLGSFIAHRLRDGAVETAETLILLLILPFVASFVLVRRMVSHKSGIFR